jgi:hypothetical protein
MSEKPKPKKKPMLKVSGEPGVNLIQQAAMS